MYFLLLFIVFSQITLEHFVSLCWFIVFPECFGLQNAFNWIEKLRFLETLKTLLDNIAVCSELLVIS